MSVTHPSAIRSGIADHVLDQINEGVPPGTLEFQTSGGTEVATCTFANPAFSGASSGSALATAIVDDTSATGGLMAKAVFRNAAGTIKVTCSVTLDGGGGDITFEDNINPLPGQTVHMDSLAYSAPP